MDEQDKLLLRAVDESFGVVGGLLDACKFRAGLQETLALATRVNQYLEDTSPWKAAKSDLAAAGRSLYVALQAISGLKILFAPVLPFTSQQLHVMLGEEGELFGRQLIEQYQEKHKTHIALTYDATEAVGRWQLSDVPSGRQLPKPTPLYKKLDESVIDDELARLV